MSISGMWYFADFSAVLGMMKIKSSQPNAFMGTRVREIKVNSDLEKEWYWLTEIVILLTWTQNQPRRLKTWKRAQKTKKAWTG